jgi:hypothetical protein
MPTHNFSLVGGMFLHFNLRVEVIKNLNLIWNQIGLEFRKDGKNKQPFLFFFSAMGRNLLTGPARHQRAARVAASGGYTARGPVGHRPAQLVQRGWRRPRPAVTRPTELVPRS